MFIASRKVGSRAETRKVSLIYTKKNCHVPLINKQEDWNVGLTMIGTEHCQVGINRKVSENCQFGTLLLIDYSLLHNYLLIDSILVFSGESLIRVHSHSHRGSCQVYKGYWFLKVFKVLWVKR